MFSYAFSNLFGMFFKKKIITVRKCPTPCPFPTDVFLKGYLFKERDF